MDHASTPDSLVVRLCEGFDRLAFVQRSDLWRAAHDIGLNPVQVQTLGLLAGRPAGLRSKEIVAHLGISAASFTDTLAALVRKGLVLRDSDPSDARAVLVRATPAGLRLNAEIGRTPSQLANALAALPAQVLEEVLVAQIFLIRQLQTAGAIPLQRMCISCRHFRPHAHPDATKPHHCAFVNAAIGSRDLRLDCGEHEVVDPVVQAATWKTFVDGSASLQAKSST